MLCLSQRPWLWVQVIMAVLFEVHKLFLWSSIDIDEKQALVMWLNIVFLYFEIELKPQTHRWLFVFSSWFQGGGLSIDVTKIFWWPEYQLVSHPQTTRITIIQTVGINWSKCHIGFCFLHSPIKPTLCIAMSAIRTENKVQGTLYD